MLLLQKKKKKKKTSLNYLNKEWYMAIEIGALDADRYVKQHIILFLNRTWWHDAKFENRVFHGIATFLLFLWNKVIINRR